jgi:hypothetical protein
MGMYSLPDLAFAENPIDRDAVASTTRGTRYETVG